VHRKGCSSHRFSEMIFKASPGGLKKESGAAAVEFALISIVLFTILFGIIEFGQFYSQFQVFQSAAREGARVASVRPAAPGSVVTPATVSAAVLAAAAPYGSKINGAISVTPASGCTVAAKGTAITVSWPQSFNVTLPFVPAINFTQTIKGVFRCEG
jgi:Flp pilus assembly protein TadG